MAGPDVLDQVWTRATRELPPPSSAAVAATAAVAFALVAYPPAWRWARHLVTIAHEASHGLAALATGRRLSGIRLHSDTSGLTLSKGRARGPGMVVTAAAGYVGTALLGAGAAYLLHRGNAAGLLWLTVLVLALMLLQIRNWFGLQLLLIAVIAVFALTWWGTSRIQTYCAYGEAWFLLMAAPRPVVELQTSRHRGSRSSDADTLARLTRLPGLVWIAIFMLVTLAALALGAYWLVPT